MVKPEKGFQRIVNETRAKQIANPVLDEGRTFPNAIILATKTESFPYGGNRLRLPSNAKFLVVDGQHRLWAQKYSTVDDTSSSLRWDLYRLVRNDEQATVMTSDIVYALATDEDTPFAPDKQIDLTGEETERRAVTIRQGSLAPEISTLLRRHTKRNPEIGLEGYVALFIRFFTAIRSLDPDKWDDANSAFFKARVLRAMIRVLDKMM
jgi:hypothetical protein